MGEAYSGEGLLYLDTSAIVKPYSLGEHLGGITTYDSRLAEALEADGVEVLAPG